MIFDVVVWPVWSRDVNGFVSLPVVAWVDTSAAFAAVERVMRWYGLRYAGHAAARSRDGCLFYRAYGVKLVDEQGCGTEREVG